MKSNLLTLLFIFLIGYSYSQGTNCLGSQPFCSDQSYTFPASTNTTAQNGPDYSCLSSQPNPAWYHLQIGISGSIEITLTNSQNEDIDFTCWGPFSSPTSACTAQLTYDDGNPGLFQGACGDGGLFTPVSNYPCGNTVDCSFDPQATEVVNIPNAQIGDYYILMITNFSGNATNISAQQTGGSGGTNCAIVDPCDISSITKTVSTCNASNNEYSINGTVSFTDAPSTGQLIIEDCSGTQQTFNAPFTTSQNYNFTGLNSNGASCSIEAYFTDDLTCTLTVSYNSPPSCMCNADAGTTTTTINGSGVNNYVLCDGDEISIQSNNDNSPPLDRGIINGASYSPGLGFAVYTCLPTPNTAPLDDPCFSGFFTGTLDNFNETNTNGTSPLLNSLIANGVTITDNTIYIAPVTLYNDANQAYDLACFSVGTPVSITYLESITTNVVESCINNTSEVTISGSYPNNNASNFTLSNPIPANIALSSNTIANGAAVNITGLLPGDNYTFEISDDNGCVNNFSGGPFGGISVETIDTTICIGGTATLLPIISGGTGPLNYLWDNGETSPSITSNPSVNETNCLTVTDASGCSSGSQCIEISLNPTIALVVSSDTTICLGDTTSVTATVSGGIGTPYNYSWDNSLGNSSSNMVNPLVTTTYNVTVTDVCETPSQTNAITVTVIQPPVYSFQADLTGGCPPLSVYFTSSGVPSGFSELWSFEEGNTSSSNNTHNFITPGCWTTSLKITSPEGCISSEEIINYICIDQPPLIDFSFTPKKPTTLDPEVSFINSTSGAAYYEWNVIDQFDTTSFTSEDITYSFPPDKGGDYEVCLIAENINGCADTTCKIITVIDDLILYIPNSFSPDNDAVNDIFIPILSGAKEGSYIFRIFNRWGEILFETESIDEGWDGTFNGSPVKTDTYIWKIQVADEIKNKKKEYTGHVNLLK
jgi:gliding motility-associated-like protein